MKTMKQRTLFITVATMVVLAVLLGACNTASAGTKTALRDQIPEITIKAADFTFDAPDQIEAGLVKVNLVNDGQEPHHAQIVRLNDGVDPTEQFKLDGPVPDNGFARLSSGQWAGLQRCIQEWLNMLLGQPHNITTTGRDARRTVEVAEAAYRAEASGRVVALPIEPRPWESGTEINRRERGER